MGDGTSLWTMTHSRDFAKGFVGLLGKSAVHRAQLSILLPMKYLPGTRSTRVMAEAAGVELKAVHIASDLSAE